MKRIAFVLYRQWAFDIFTAIQEHSKMIGTVEIPLLITTAEHEFVLPDSVEYTVSVVRGNDQAAINSLLEKHQIDSVCFYGWSWLVKQPLLSDYTCLCLHPSPLPKYRGGTPIQHQLVSGEQSSAVTIFKMKEGIDDGDIYIQIPIPLDGYLSDILGNIVSAGIEGTKRYLADIDLGQVVFSPQVDLERNPPLRRRTYEDGEVSLLTIKSKTYNEIYNIVRGLQAPYPNAYIKNNSHILYIQEVDFAKELPTNLQLLNQQENWTVPTALALHDGYLIITRGVVANLT